MFQGKFQRNVFLLQMVQNQQCEPERSYCHVGGKGLCSLQKGHGLRTHQKSALCQIEAPVQNVKVYSLMLLCVEFSFYICIYIYV